MTFEDEAEHRTEAGRIGRAQALAEAREAEREFAKDFVAGKVRSEDVLTKLANEKMSVDALAELLPEDIVFDTPLYDALVASLQSLFGSLGLTPEANVLLQGEQAAHLAGIRDEIRTLTRTIAAVADTREQSEYERHAETMKIQAAILEELQNIAREMRHD